MEAAQLIAMPRAVPGVVAAAPVAAIEACAVERCFNGRSAIAGVSLSVAPGEIHALLGPNGAGKTTLLRLLSGMLRPDGGSVSVLGHDARRRTREQQLGVALVPAGDRSFYLRLSALENLFFFARLHGFRAAEARRRALTVLEAVGLAEARRKRVGECSHGMQKRLAVARALLTDPRVLLVDEATHDLDPHGARVVRDLVADVAAAGTAVVWATQRIDEIRDFAARATLLRAGRVVFAGDVLELTARVRVSRHVVRLQMRGTPSPPSRRALQDRLGRLATIDRAAGGEHGLFLLDVAADASLGDALCALLAGGVEVISCREVRSELEEAFVQLTSGS